MKTVVVICLLVCLVASTAFGQIKLDKTNSFVVKGTIKNFSKNIVNIGVSDFFDNRDISVPVVDGKFYQSLPLTSVQDVYAMDGDNSVKLLAAPGDTLTLNWDSKDFTHTFKAAANTNIRQRDLDILKQLQDKFDDRFFATVKTLSSKTTTDSVKLKSMAQFFTEEFRFVMAQKDRSI